MIDQKSQLFRYEVILPGVFDVFLQKWPMIDFEPQYFPFYFFNYSFGALKYTLEAYKLPKRCRNGSRRRTKNNFQNSLSRA